jgi:hypothetical protein
LSRELGWLESKNWVEVRLGVGVEFFRAVPNAHSADKYSDYNGLTIRIILKLRGFETASLVIIILLFLLF